MPFTLVTGRAHAGKTAVLHAMVRDELSHGGEPVLVVPTRADVERAVEQLACDAPIGLRIMRFDDLIEALCAASGDGRAIISDTQRALLIERAAAGVRGHASPGLAAAACRVVDRLGGEAGAAWRNAHGGGDLGATVRAYAAEAAVRGLVEPGEAAEAGVNAGRVPPAVLAVGGFSELTGLEECMVRGLSNAGWRVAVALTWEQGFPATEGLSPLVERLARLGEHRHLPPSAEPADAPDLRRVESEVFQAGLARMPDGGIEFRFAEGEEAEAEAVAEAVLGICASGIAPSEVAVLYRAPARHAAALAHAFAEAGIAADFDTPVAFGAVPLGRALCGLLGFAAGGGRDLLLAYLRSAFSGADREVVARLEADWRRRGVTDRAALARGARTLGVRVVRDLDDISRADGPDARAVERLAARMMASAHGRDGRITPSADEDARAYQVLVRTLGDLDGLGGEGPLRAGELAEVLRRAEVAGGRPARAGRVRVMSVARARGHRFDAVVLAGLTDDEFPAAPDDAFGSAEVRELFRSVGAAEPEWGGVAMERALFYEAVTRARRRLVLCRQVTDSSGTPLGASPFWEELRDLYRAPEAEAEADVVDGADGHRTLLEAGLGVAGGPGGREALRRAAASVRRAPRQDTLTDPHVLARLASQEVYSASEIESYLQCPFRWFVEKQLRAEPLDLAVDALTRGTVAHAALRDLYERLPAEAGAVRVTAGCLPAAAGLVDGAVDAALSGERVPADASDAMRADVARLLLRHLRTEADSLHGFAPAHLEWSFGGRDDEGPADLGGFSLKGCVDRIDEAADGSVIVIDYKTGGAVEVRDWAERGRVQLPLYAAAVAQRFGREVVGCFYRGLTKGSVKRFVGPYVEGRVTGGVAPKDALPADGFAEAVGDALGRAGAAVAGMRAGGIPAAPGGDASKTCRYCPAAGYCGREAR